MPHNKGTSSDLFIVDNGDKDWKVLQYLKEWADISHSFDIATGYFEIGALLAMDGKWRQLDKLRILMGDEVSARTKKALLAGVDKLNKILDDSIEKQKETNDFLSGVPAIVEALRKRQIECKVYNKNKFHAKAYITHSKLAVVGSSALVGSSNLTYPGLTENIELNIQIRREVEILQKWFERHWNEAEDITPEILKVIERHTHEYTPFEVYTKSMQEFFRGHEMTAGEWEQHQSRMYKVLDKYQKEGYQALMKIAATHGGALLCDGVGLGKTFIGLMVIERLIMHDRKRVALFVPKAARGPVWDTALRHYLPKIKGAYSNLIIFNHTDLHVEKCHEDLERVREMADVIVIDEAHHFRNPGIAGEGDRRPSRYRRFYEIVDGKTLYLLTATPVNNKLIDLQHMIELFSRREKPDYFKTMLGIHSLPGHFRSMEKKLEQLTEGNRAESDEEPPETNEVEAEKVLLDDILFKALVVQRSRAYVRESQLQEGAAPTAFPIRDDPKVVSYSLKKTYDQLLLKIKKAFSKEKPLFSLAIYYPLAYYKGQDQNVDPMIEGRQKQVVGLIRTSFLKRFESSSEAFKLSCVELLIKLLAFIEKHSTTPSEVKRLQRWKDQHSDLIEYIKQLRHVIDEATDQGDEYEDIITEEMLEMVKELPRDQYKVEEIIAESFLDLDQLEEFLRELKKFKPTHDDKLKALTKLLKTDLVLKKNKVLIFTDYMATAKYLKKELQDAAIDGVDEVDGASKGDRGEIIKQFSPYYNGSSTLELAEKNIQETRVLISTDVLSEGLNLQDATRLINYDLHWNPVRLMQRIGRVDRRLNPEIEKQILEDHPEQNGIRGNIVYWNFLPPDELDELLSLYAKVSKKALRISKTFGIEGRKLLKPEDDYDALKNFNHIYEGTTSTVENMLLEYQKLLKEHPDLEERLSNLPGRVFSGKTHPSPGAKAVFFCYALPGPKSGGSESDAGAENWSEETGSAQWYLFDLSTEKIIEEPAEIINFIRSQPDTPRVRDIPDKTISEIRRKIEKHIKNTYLKRLQAPIGVNAILKAWMELN